MWSRGLVALVVAGFGTIALRGQAGAAPVLCQKKNGSVVVRDPACKKKETALSLAQFGAQGPKGDTGAPGTPGSPGPAGPFPDPLPSGKTVRGDFAFEDVASGASSHATSSISFGFTLSAAPTPHVVLQGGTPPSQCPGTLASPEAQSGHLCIYEGPNTNRSFFGVGDPVTNMGGAANKFGARLNLFSTAAGPFDTSGTWAVTAP